MIRSELLAMLHDIEHTETQIATDAEQAFSRAIGGGCKLPIGCYARVEDDNVFLSAMVGDSESGHVVRRSVSG